MKTNNKAQVERRRMAFETMTTITDMLREMMPKNYEIVTGMQEYDDFINITASVYNNKIDVAGSETHIYKNEYLHTDGTETLRISEAKCKDLIDTLKTEAENYMKLYNKQQEQAEAEQDNQPQQ